MLVKHGHVMQVLQYVVS